MSAQHLFAIVLGVFYDETPLAVGTKQEENAAAGRSEPELRSRCASHRRNVVAIAQQQPVVLHRRVNTIASLHIIQYRTLFCMKQENWVRASFGISTPEVFAFL